MMLVRGVRLAATGLAVGFVMSLGLAGALTAFLFGVQARDPMVFVAVPLVLSVVVLIAVALPASRASRVDLVDALRQE